jgi:hypothetical protein
MLTEFCLIRHKKMLFYYYLSQYELFMATLIPFPLNEGELNLF